MSPITIIKLNLARQETFRYGGEVLEWRPDGVLLEAFFNRPDLPFHGLVMGQGDRFVEGYYTHRWYNIFEMHARQDDHLKGWYCNVTRPASSPIPATLPPPRFPVACLEIHSAVKIG